jgi:hypothetical protein
VQRREWKRCEALYILIVRLSCVGWDSLGLRILVEITFTTFEQKYFQQTATHSLRLQSYSELTSKNRTGNIYRNKLSVLFVTCSMMMLYVLGEPEGGVAFA